MRANRVEAKSALNEQINAFIYCRVSSVGQRGNYSIGDKEHSGFQEDKCREYALEHGYTVLDVVSEQHSGAMEHSHTYNQSYLDGYVQLMGIIKRLKEGEADILLLWNSDRLTRSIVHDMAIYRESYRYGYVIQSVSKTEKELEDKIGNALNELVLKTGVDVKEICKLFENMFSA